MRNRGRGLWAKLPFFFPRSRTEAVRGAAGSARGDGPPGSYGDRRVGD
jgi:hypothetical protein